MKKGNRIYLMGWTILLQIVLFIVPLVITIVCLSIFKPKEILIIVMCATALLLFVLNVLRLLRYYIILEEERLFINREFRVVNRKQNNYVVTYESIKDVRLAIVFEDAQGAPTFYQRGVYLANAFLELVISPFVTKRIFVSHLSKKLVQQILDKIGEKTGIQREYKQLVKDAKERHKKETMHRKP